MVELISYYTQNSLKESFAGLSKSEEDIIEIGNLG